jgi:hypothetical protein
LIKGVAPISTKRKSDESRADIMHSHVLGLAGYDDDGSRFSEALLSLEAGNSKGDRNIVLRI